MYCIAEFPVLEYPALHVEITTTDTSPYFFRHLFTISAKTFTHFIFTVNGILQSARQLSTPSTSKNIYII